MVECLRTIPGLHRWCHKLLKRFAYVILAVIEGDTEVLQQYNRSISRLQTCLQQRLRLMHSNRGHHHQDLEILLQQTERMRIMVACVPRCLAADIVASNIDSACNVPAPQPSYDEERHCNGPCSC